MSEIALPTVPAGLIFGRGSPMQPILDTCRRIAPSDATVLLTGETGTGKEVVARAIHDMHVATTGSRGAFVPVNCGAIPETLLEAELFGHAKGAFTGAHMARKGRVAMAEGGTLFLDEIGELGLGPQVKLLRLLQEKTFEPVGESRSVKASFRLIAATNRDLAAEVKAGRFRQDLYYRLFVCPIELPPLRARPMDIAALVSHFWEKRGDGRPLSEGVLNRLLAYPWPGNVRELENLIERVRVTAAGSVVMEHDLPERYRTGPMAYSTPPVAVEPITISVPVAMAPAPSTRGEDELNDDEGFDDHTLETAATTSDLDRSFPPISALDELETSGPIDLPRRLRDLEWSYIDAALKHARGNKQAAARLLGLRRTTLVEKLRRRASDEPTMERSAASM